MTAKVTEIWRYPVKSMSGERIDASGVGDRGLHADRMWALRDPALGAISTARRLPPLLKCTARYPQDPADFPAGPGNAPEVVITLPSGEEVSSADPQVHEKLSALVGKEVRLEPLPPLSEKERYRGPKETKADLRAAFGVPEGEPLPDMSMFPLRLLAELSRNVTPVGSLADAYPVHLITTASLATLAAHTPGSDFDIRRFRPNLVVDTGGQDGLPENAWCGAELATSEATLRGEIPTLRCVMPTREQIGLPADPDVLRTVAARARHCLGLYLTVQRAGVISVGDEIDVRIAEPSRPVAMAKAGATTLKRGVLRAASALIPNE